MDRRTDAPWPQDHGGDVYGLPSSSVARDFSASINPLGCPEGVTAALLARWNEVLHYPDRRSARLRAAIARRYEIDAERVLAGNGSAELIDLSIRALGGTRVLLCPPDFGLYGAFRAAGVPLETVPRIEDQGFAVDDALLAARMEKGDLVLFSNPANPSGHALDRERVLALAERADKVGATLLVDEAFADFAPSCSVLDRAGNPPALAVLRSLTKFYGIPGVRLGFLAAAPEVLSDLADLQPPWSVSVPAQIVGETCLGDDNWASKSREYVNRARERFAADLRNFPGIHPLPSAANYLLVRLDPPAPDAGILYRRLAAEGTIVRHCGSFGLGERYVRIAVRTVGENADLLRHLQRHYAEAGVSAR